MEDHQNHLRHQKAEVKYWEQASPIAWKAVTTESWVNERWIVRQVHLASNKNKTKINQKTAHAYWREIQSEFKSWELKQEKENSACVFLGCDLNLLILREENGNQKHKRKACSCDQCVGVRGT